MSICIYELGLGIFVPLNLSGTAYRHSSIRLY